MLHKIQDDEMCDFLNLHQASWRDVVVLGSWVQGISTPFRILAPFQHPRYIKDPKDKDHDIRKFGLLFSTMLWMLKHTHWVSAGFSDEKIFCWNISFLAIRTFILKFKSFKKGEYDQQRKTSKVWSFKIFLNRYFLVDFFFISGFTLYLHIFQPISPKSKTWNFLLLLHMFLNSFTYSGALASVFSKANYQFINKPATLSCPLHIQKVSWKRQGQARQWVIFCLSDHGLYSVTKQHCGIPAEASSKTASIKSYRWGSVLFSAFSRTSSRAETRGDTGLSKWLPQNTQRNSTLNLQTWTAASEIQSQERHWESRNETSWHMCPSTLNFCLSHIAVCNEMALNTLEIRESFQALNKTKGKKNHQVLTDKLQMEREAKYN